MTGRLRLSADERQGRLLPKAQMPKAPLEKELVIALRKGLGRLGLVNWSGRIHIRAGKYPYLPVLGSGTPDVLFVTRAGRLCGLEAKREAGSDLRETQQFWADVARGTGVRVRMVDNVEDGLRFALECAKEDQDLAKLAGSGVR